MIKIKVECECGEEFEIEVDDRRYRSKGEYDESKMGKKHCPNPDCDKTVHINANVYSCVELDEELNNPNIDWEEIKVGDAVHFKEKDYDVALKVTRKLRDKELTETEINLLYLRSRWDDINLILEVRESGFLSSLHNDVLKHVTMSDEEADFLKKE